MFSRQIEKAKEDPILGLMKLIKGCTSPNKIDMTIGIYSDETGHCTLMDTVKEAELLYAKEETTKAYLGIAGSSDFCTAVESKFYNNLFEENGKVAETINTPGGSGAIRISAELCKTYNPGGTCWVGTPAWANYRHIFTSTGYKIDFYDYLQEDDRSKPRTDLGEQLKDAKPGDAIILQGPCHNPTGIDFNLEQWDSVFQFLVEKEITPIFDNAYIGLAAEVDEDSKFLTLACKYFKHFIISTSFSKNFALYRDRVGAFTIVGDDKESVSTIKGHACSIVRSIYSMPPHHGAAVVNTILNSEELHGRWTQELAQIRNRIFSVRKQLDSKLIDLARFKLNFLQNHGMFNIIPLDNTMLNRLRDEFGIFIVGSGRINITSLNEKNIDYFCSSLLSVMNQK